MPPKSVPLERNNAKNCYLIWVLNLFLFKLSTSPVGMSRKRSNSVQKVKDAVLHKLVPTVRWAPPDRPPKHQRRQNFAICFFCLIAPLAMISVFSIPLVLAWWPLMSHFVEVSIIWWPVIAVPYFLYVVWMFIDKSSEDGSRRPCARKWKCWKWYADYFPLRLIKTHDLDPHNKYIFAYHPHGLIAMGAAGAFATDACGFKEKFPGIDIRVLTLNMNFYAPFTRELFLSMGVCSVARRSCNKILQRGKGSAILIAVGGAAESLDAHPGSIVLTLARQGFVRVALDNGAKLVPTLAFGENEIYDSVDNPRGSRLRNWQKWMQRTFGLAPVFFSGRGLFSHGFGTDVGYFSLSAMSSHFSLFCDANRFAAISPTYHHRVRSTRRRPPSSEASPWQGGSLLRTAFIVNTMCDMLLNPSSP